MILRRHLHAFESELVGLAEALPPESAAELAARAHALLALRDARPFVAAGTPLHHTLNEIAILLTAADELGVIPRRRLARAWRRLACLLDVGAAVPPACRRPNARHRTTRRPLRLRTAPALAVAGYG